jgi:hypothetical protein
MTLFYLGLAIILTVAITAALLYVQTAVRSTFNIEDLLSPPWDDNSASNVKTVESGAKPQKAVRKPRKKTASTQSKPKGKVK